MRLRPLRPGDEGAALAAHAELVAEAFPFLLEYAPDMPWEAYLGTLDAYRKAQQLAPGRVPATFLAATVDDALVGRLSIRHELNDWLSRYGGHIGYGIRPTLRRRGYATEALRQGLIVARAVGIDDVLVVCDDANTASARVIETNGGKLDSVIDGEHGGPPQRRYWIR